MDGLRMDMRQIMDRFLTSELRREEVTAIYLAEATGKATALRGVPHRETPDRLFFDLGDFMVGISRQNILAIEA
jgi:type IV secretory pathway ATPase VirB11/archaellum biosynthesis ATPase